MDLLLKPERLQSARQAESVRARWFDPGLIALFAMAVSAVGARRPSFWYDEAATISAATRPLAELWRLLGNVDAVHGLYYLVMHGWFAVFDATEFWSRFSSCLAVGGAAAGVFVLGKQFSTRAVAVTAGIVFAILPRITWAGIEARPYALSVLAAVWLTALVVAALRRDSPALWVFYALLLAVGTALSLFVVLMVFVHAVLVALTTTQRSAVRHWLAASSTAVLVVCPLLLFCHSQVAHVHWITAPGTQTIGEVVLEQYFGESVTFVIAAIAVIAVALVLRRPAGWDIGTRQLAGLATAWMALPTAQLVIYSVWFEPIYYPRYLSFTSAAMALLLAICIVSVVRTRARITLVLGVFALAALPNYLFVQRDLYAKEGMDFSQVADVITANAAPGDCLIMDNTTDWKPGPIRALTAVRPDAYEALVDPGRGARAEEGDWLWDQHLGIWGVADQVSGCRVLWTVSELDSTLPHHQRGRELDPGPRLAGAPAYQVPHRMGFHIVERWQFSFSQVVKSTR